MAYGSDDRQPHTLWRRRSAREECRDQTVRSSIPAIGPSADMLIGWGHIALHILFGFQVEDPQCRCGRNQQQAGTREETHRPDPAVGFWQLEHLPSIPFDDPN